VIWNEFDGGDWEAFLFNGRQVLRLTDNSTDDRFPEIFDGEAFWEGHDGSDYEIYLYRTGPLCPGDIDRDGDVDTEDFLLFTVDWGRDDCKETPEDCSCDLNKDGGCSLPDYQLFIQDWVVSIVRYRLDGVQGSVTKSGEERRFETGKRS